MNVLVKAQRNPSTPAGKLTVIQSLIKAHKKHLSFASPLIVAVSLLVTAPIGLAGDEEVEKQQRQKDRRELLRELDRNSQIAKERALDLEHALYKLELDSQMHPLAETRWFFAIQTKKPYTIQRLRVEVDGKALIDNSYHPQQAGALNQDGAERVFHGNLSAGEHNITAYVEGYFKEDDRILSYETSANFTLEKQRGLTHLLLALSDSKRTWEPELRLQVWQ